MRIKVQVIVEQDDGIKPIVDEIVCLQRGDLSPEKLGLTINESKQILGKLQKTITNCQINDYIRRFKNCPDCGKSLPKKDTKEIYFRSVFGELKFFSPRLKTCSCSEIKKKSFSPLSKCLPERTSPELLYLQAKWASLMSFGVNYLFQYNDLQLG